MSPINIQKLVATTPTATVASGTRQGSDAASATGPSARPAPQDGVSVELSAPVRQPQAPVDSDRVAEIRAALRDGNYPIVPAEIADAMIAARHMLGFGE